MPKKIIQIACVLKLEEMVKIIKTEFFFTVDSLFSNCGQIVYDER